MEWWKPQLQKKEATNSKEVKFFYVLNLSLGNAYYKDGYNTQA
jgi:hypothetical protein